MSNRQEITTKVDLVKSIESLNSLHHLVHEDFPLEFKKTDSFSKFSLDKYEPVVCN